MIIHVLGFNRGWLHFVLGVSHLDFKIAMLENMLKGFSPRLSSFLEFNVVLFSLSGLISFIECLALFCSLVINWTRASKYSLSKI